MLETENKQSDFGKISCGVPQGYILGPLPFLIYANDMTQAVKSNLLFMIHALCTNTKTLQKLKKMLNEDFENLCDWFVDNKLSIHFGDDKTKSVLFASKGRTKKILKLNIR